MKLSNKRLRKKLREYGYKDKTLSKKTVKLVLFGVLVIPLFISIVIVLMGKEDSK